MTGFGRGTASRGPLNCTVEIKTVNHRFCDIQIRLGNSLLSLEGPVRERIQSRLGRGRIEVFVNCEGDVKRRIRLDEEMARAYAQAAARLGRVVGRSAGVLDINRLVQLPEVVRFQEVRVGAGQVWPVMRQALDRALEQLVAARTAEGRRLAKDILARVKLISGMVDRMKKRAPQVVVDYRRRLEQKLRGMNSSDKGKVDNEIVIFAERADITEELVRAKSHLKEFELLARRNSSGGRRLDFLGQEILREINTMASKANDQAITTDTLKVREELEKIREQIQNIE
jgi:uncharacterized protein (TIGR00255 family)